MIHGFNMLNLIEMSKFIIIPNTSLLLIFLIYLKMLTII